MMASSDKENTQTLKEAILLKFGTPNANESTQIGAKFIIPQLKIPQLQTSKPTTAEALAAQEEHRRAADAHNELLLSAIKQRREQSNSQEGQSTPNALYSQQINQNSLLTGVSGGFTIPKLRTATGELLEEPQFNIPLLNKLRSQNNSLELNQLEQKKIVQGVSKLKISTDDGGDSAKLKNIQKQQTASTSPLIDLTTTVIAVAKNAPPRESASQMRHKQAQAAVEHFDIPFISCDSMRNRMGHHKLPRERKDSNFDEPESNVVRVVEQTSVVGSMLDASVGYPRPRKPQLRYAATAVEMQHLKICKRDDYGGNIKRFRFDTPSPDELVKIALQKSWRISRT